MIPHVRVNAALLDLFELFRIRSSETGQRWREGGIRQVQPGAVLEKYYLIERSMEPPRMSVLNAEKIFETGEQLSP